GEKRGEEGFANPGGEPAAPPTKAKTKPPVSTAVEADERRPPIRTRIIGSRAPAPSAANVVPTSIVKWRITPRRVVNPSPAPGTNVTPIAVAVRSPANVDDSWIPNVAIFGNFIPSAVVIEVAVANGVAANILTGNGIVFFSVAAICPTVKAVGAGCR